LEVGLLIQAGQVPSPVGYCTHGIFVEGHVAMKTKHYPLITAALGAALVLIPGILLLFFFHSGDDATTNAIIDQAIAPQSAALVTTQTKTNSLESRPTSSVTQVASARDPLTHLSETPLQLHEPIPTTSLTASPTGLAVPSHETFDLQATNSTELSPQPVPSPVDAGMADLVLSDAINEKPADPAADVIEIPRRPVVAESYYDATGHLAMVGKALVPDPLTNAPSAVVGSTGEPVAKDGEPAVEKDAADSITKEAKRGSSRRRGKKEDDEVTAVSTGGNSQTPPATAETNPFLRGPATGPKDPDAADPALIEDVVINTPADNSHVNRVEDVVATTVAKGWPIALVRSDLPDDLWWVQQVIGIQGNAFGARVNFGNESTVRGSAYRMVIVFLDSPDEVRRFRIAKQFKEIPDGVRRSREFHYIRR
jgi:hypothetical protein